jgi:hypothetical protein
MNELDAVNYLTFFFFGVVFLVLAIGWIEELFYGDR